MSSSSNAVTSPAPEASPHTTATGEGSMNNLMSLFSDTKHVIHVALEIIVFGAIFYYSKSSNTALKGAVDVLQDQIDDQKNEIDKLKTTVGHLTDSVNKLTALVESFRVAPKPAPRVAPQVTSIPKAPTPAPTPAPIQAPTQAPNPAPIPAPIQAPVPSTTLDSVPTVDEYNSGATTMDDELAAEIQGLK